MQPVCLRESASLHTEWCGSRSTKHPPQIKHINILTAPSVAHRKCWRRGFNLFGLRSIEMVGLVSVRSENNYAGSREAPSVPFVQSRGLCDLIREDKYVTRDALRERRPLSTSAFPHVLRLPPVVGRYRQKWYMVTGQSGLLSDDSWHTIYGKSKIKVLLNHHQNGIIMENVMKIHLELFMRFWSKNLDIQEILNPVFVSCLWCFHVFLFLSEGNKTTAFSIKTFTWFHLSLL